MTTSTPTSKHAQENDEIDLIDILLFLKASARNVVICTATSLLLGASHHFSMPNMYEATATIQFATVAGQFVETPPVTLEKIKLPHFFSPAAIQACGGGGEQGKFAERIKPTLNKSAPFVSFTIQAHSTKEARVCLDAVFGEIQKYQNELAKPLIDHKKKTLSRLDDQLKFAEDDAKSAPVRKPFEKAMEIQFANQVFLAKDRERKELRAQIDLLASELAPPQTQPTLLAVPVYAPNVPLTKRAHFTFGVSLALGVFIGFLLTGVKRALPNIRKQMSAAELQ